MKESSTSKRNMGGRRPKNSANLSPEEEEKRPIRRERNKLAAARCRKRRVDHTMELEGKVQVLENEKQKLQREIQDLQALKEDLDCLLQAHRTQCKLQLNAKLTLNTEFEEPRSTNEFKDPMLKKIKVEVEDTTYDDVSSPTKHLISTANPIISAVTNPVINSALSGASKPLPTRPSTLAVPFVPPPPSQIIASNKNIADIAGIQITTPSNGVIFNFDSLMDGGTGLTPVAMPSSFSQHKNPLDLATPTSESLVSL